MSVNNMAVCNPEHSSDIAYICYGNKQAFCRPCFRTHRDKCASSKCGDAHRLCYSILEKYEYCKLKMNLLTFNPSNSEFRELKDAYASNFFNYCRLIQQHITRKVPYFVLQMQNKLVERLLIREFGSISSTTEGQVNFDKIYNNITTTIRKGKHTRQDLDFLINELNKATQLQNSLKDSSKKRSDSSSSSSSLTKAKDALQLAKKIKTQLEYHLDVKDEIDKIIMEKMGSIISKLSVPEANITYEGLEGLSLDSDIAFSQLKQNGCSMLEAAKNILKKSLFEESSQILGLTGFPYKYCYVISTCPSPDEHYERLVLNMEGKLIQTMNSGNSSAKSIAQLTKRIIIMGPEVIEMRFSYDKKYHFLTMTIFGYDASRKPFYESILSQLGIYKNSFIDKTADSNRIVMDKVSQPLDMIYNNIEIAYSLIFKDHYVESQSQRIRMGQEFMEREVSRKDGPKTLLMEEFKRREFELAMID